MDERKENKKQRGIESIAHLFLSELDKQREGSSGMRTPPVNDSPVESDESGRNDITDSAADHGDVASDDPGRDDFTFDLSGSLQGEIVLAYHLSDSYSKVCDYAEYQSQRDERVALVSIDQYEVTLLAAFNSDPVDQPVIIAETEGTAASLIPLINEAADGFDTIILNIDPSFAPRVNEIISHADCVTVITDCTNDGIVSAYQVLKSVAADIEGDQEVALFVCDAINEEYADRAYYKFAETAKKFIERTIIPAGCLLLEKPEQQPVEDHFPVSPDHDVQGSNIQQPQVEPEFVENSEIESLQDRSEEIDSELHDDKQEKVEQDDQSYIISSDTYHPEELIVQADSISSDEAFDSVQTDNVYIEEKPDVSEQVVEKSFEKPKVQPVENIAPAMGYRPSVSFDQEIEEVEYPDVRIFKEGQLSGLDDLLPSSSESRKAVISRPLQEYHSGPAQVAPVEVAKPLENDLEIAHFVGTNLARLSDRKGMVSIELQQFEDVFPYARVMVDIEGKVYVVLSAVYSDNVSDNVELVVQWLSDNIGAIATRYRILKIKAYLPIQVILIAGTNFNAVYDEALIAADELDADCAVYQLSSFKLGGKNYVSLQYS